MVCRCLRLKCCKCSVLRNYEQEKAKKERELLKIKNMILEYLYGSQEEKPRKKINLDYTKKVTIKHNKSSNLKRWLAVKRIRELSN